ncbi:MAG TPA: DUF3450 domain-containing protein [Fontimonas sp.]
MAALALALAASVALAQGDALERAVTTAESTQRASIASQERIDKLDDQTKDLLERYRAAVWQSQQLNVYAEQLAQLTAGQEAERASLQRQLVEMERTEREILPLMLRMFDGLEKLVAADLPFLQEERKERLENLRRLMANPETGVAEKYRRVLEAYQIEAEYGRSLGAERTQIGERTVDVLRVGRTGLYAITLDGSESFQWDAATAKWVELDRKYQAAVKKGIRMARETMAADLIVLPMPAATGDQP